MESVTHCMRQGRRKLLMHRGICLVKGCVHFTDQKKIGFCTVLSENQKLIVRLSVKSKIFVFVGD